MRLLHEGPDIQMLLGDIRSEHGADARIVKAERVRTGGIAGFFAKQHFEVTLELPDEPEDTTPSLPMQRTGSPAATITPLAAGASSLEALIAAAEREDLTAAPAAPAVEDETPVVDPLAHPKPGDAFATVLQTVAAWEERDQAGANPAAAGDLQVVQTEDITGQLAGLEPAPAPEAPAEAAPEPATVEHTATEPDEIPATPDLGLADRTILTAVSTPAATNEPALVPAAAETAPAAEGAAPTEAPGAETLLTHDRTAGTEPQPVAAAAPEPAEPAPTAPAVDLPRQVDAGSVAASTGPIAWTPKAMAPEDLVGARVLRRPTPAPEPTPEPVAATATPTGASRRAGLAAYAEAAQAADPASEPQPADSPQAAEPAMPRTRRERRMMMRQRTADSPVLTRLTQLGLPESLVAQLPSDPTTADLAHVLGQLPRASSSRPEEGEVIAILVEPGEADSAGARIARRWRMQQNNVAGAGGATRLSGEKQAARLAQEARDSGVPQLLVLDAELNGFDAEWAFDVLNAARPDRVLAVVDATRKPKDIDTWLTAITGMVDAVLLVNTTATATPAAVLGLGIPVSEIDGRPGTASEWANLLMARVLEGEQ